MKQNKTPYKINLFLAKPNKVIISKLKHASDKTLVLNHNETDELSFTLPYEYIKGHIRRTYKATKKIKEKFLVKVVYGEITQWFVISDYQESASDTETMEVQAFSLEHQLSRKRTINFVRTSQNCLMVTEDVLKNTGWKVGYINPAFNIKYHSFDVSNDSKLSLLYEIAETFDAVLRFDTINKTVNFYKEDELSKYKGFTITEKKYLESIENSVDSADVITRLHVTGKDGLGIQSVNPTGQAYVDDFSYFLYPFEIDENDNVVQSSYFMEDDLAIALVKYNKYVSNRKGEFSQHLSSKSKIQQELTRESTELFELQTELQIILDEITIAKETGMEYSDAISRRNSKNRAIQAKKNIVSQLQSQVAKIDKDIKELGEDLAYENHFSPTLLEQLYDFVHEDEWTDGNKFDANDLYDSGLVQLGEINSPPVDMTIDIVNFFRVVDEKRNWDKLRKGDIVQIKHKKLNINVKARITSIEFSEDSESINVTISNKKEINDMKNKLKRAFYTIDRVNTDYNKRKINWSVAANNFNIRNDRISETPVSPTVLSSSITHRENDDGSVNLVLKWDYPEWSKTQKSEHNIDGFLIYMHSDTEAEPYQFGSQMANETMVDVIEHTRAYTFPAVPANLHYTVGIRAYRRVDEDVNRDGILMSEIARFDGTNSNVQGVQLMAMSSHVSPMINNNTLTPPYQPKTHVDFKGRIGGYEFAAGNAPSTPSPNQLWFDVENSQWMRWDELLGTWVGSQALVKFQETMDQFEKEMEKFEEELEKELEENDQIVKEAMEQLEQEMDRLHNEVLPEVEQAVKQSEIPSYGSPPEEVPESGLYWDSSQVPQRLMRWNESDETWTPLAPNEEEIQQQIQDMRDAAVADATRYSKEDIIKTRKAITDRIDVEMEDVSQGISDLESMADGLIQRVQESEEYVQGLREEIGEWGSLIDVVDEHSSWIERTDTEFTQAFGSIENMGETVSAMNTKVTENAEAIELAATKLEVEHLDGAIQGIVENVAGLTVTAEEITAEVGRIEEDLEGQITENSTAIIQTAQGINTRIDSFETNYDSDKTDILSQIESNRLDIDATAQGLLLTVTKEEYQLDLEDVDERITSTEATLDIHANEISAKAESSDLLNYVTNQVYTNKVGQLDVAIDGITATVSSIETDIDNVTGEISSATSKIASLETSVSGISGTVSSLSSDMTTAKSDIASFNIRADGIESTVSSIQTDITGLEGSMTAVQTRITQLPSEINLAVSEGIDGLEIGGTNLLKDGLTSSGVSISKQSDGSYKITNPSKSDWGRAVSHPIVLEPNQEYTASMEVLSRTGSYAGIGFREGSADHGNLTFSTTKGKVSTTYKNTTNSSKTINVWIKLYYAGTSYNKPTDNASIHIRGLQVEKGNKATDWSPAPEDQVDKTNVLSSINLSTEGVTIAGNRINLQGLVTVLNADGTAGTMIQGGKIVSSSITANQLNVNNIFGNSAIIAKIQSDSVLTANLSATRITTGTLNANNVSIINLSASIITTGTLNANNVAVTNINASNISTGTLNAARIGTGAISIGKLASSVQTDISAGASALTNAQNYVDDNTGNLVKNPQITGSHTGWSNSNQLSSSLQTFEGLSTRVMNGAQVSSGQTQTYSDYFYVDPSKAYEVSMWVRKNVATGIWYMGLNGIDSDGAVIGFDRIVSGGTIGASNDTNFYFVSGASASTTWTKLVGYIMPVGTEPADMKGLGTATNARFRSTTRRVRVRWLNWNNGTTSRTMYVAHPKVVEVDPNAVIRGTLAKELTDTWRFSNTTQIDGGNIRTNTIDANVLKANSVIANNITFTGRLSGASGTFSGTLTSGIVDTSSLIVGYESLDRWTEASATIRLKNVTRITSGVYTESEPFTISAGNNLVDMDGGNSSLGITSAGITLWSRQGNGTVIRTASGRATMGARNGSYFHMDTDRPQFYMYQPLNIQGSLAVVSSRSISTGSGLSGGGNLGANRTLSVDSTVLRTTGNQVKSGYLQSTSLSRNGGFQVGESSTLYHTFGAHGSNKTMAFFPQRYSGQNVLDIQSHHQGGAFRSEWLLSNNGEMYSPPTFDSTTTASANIRVGTSAGRFTRNTSLRAYKLNIETAKDPYKILNLEARTWFDKGDSERYALAMDKKAKGEPFSLDDIERIKRIGGLVAEEVVDAGLKTYAEFDEEGNLNGVAYDRIWTLLIPITRDLNTKTNKHDDEIKQLQNQLKLKNSQILQLKQRIERLESIVD